MVLVALDALVELATLKNSQGALGRSTSEFGQSRDHVRPIFVVGTELELGRSCRQLKPDLVQILARIRHLKF